MLGNNIGRVAFKFYNANRVLGIIMKSGLYTRSGDGGTTSLVGGERVSKDDARLMAYGTLDELSSQLGTLTSDPALVEEVRGQLVKVQQVLFDLGSYLATRPEANTEPKISPSLEPEIKELEGWIDALDEQTPKLRAFVLPGGSAAASKAHVARTVCRRCEREVVALGRMEYVDPSVLEYLNRLSDYLYISALFVNFMSGVSETVWQKR